jgi:hypothetical protein
MGTGKGRGRDEAKSGMGLPPAAPRHHHPPGRRYLAIQTLLTVILLSQGYWGWVLLTGAGAVANFGLAWLAYRRNSA